LLTRGESFGLKALYRDHFSATTKTAARKTQLICLDRKRFRSFSQKFPHIACKIHLNIVNYLIER
jgi:CRP-like cAMP-binding protein